MVLDKIIEGYSPEEAIEVLEELQQEIPSRIKFLRMEILIEELKAELSAVKEERDTLKELLDEVKSVEGEATLMQA